MAVLVRPAARNRREASLRSSTYRSPLPPGIVTTAKLQFGPPTALSPTRGLAFNEVQWRSLDINGRIMAYPGTLGRTLNEEDYDGLNEPLIKRTLEATQTLHSVLQPITPDRDVRHDEDEKYMVYIPSGSTSEKSERAGVTHLVHCWTMQGHSVGDFIVESVCAANSPMTERGLYAIKRFLPWLSGGVGGPCIPGPNREFEPGGMESMTRIDSSLSFLECNCVIYTPQKENKTSVRMKHADNSPGPAVNIRHNDQVILFPGDLLALKRVEMHVFEGEDFFDDPAAKRQKKSGGGKKYKPKPTPPGARRSSCPQEARKRNLKEIVIVL
ncbi:hypothetical protein B0H13DRAFT_1869573 [Mycena leptocephala]|nr:hypothetical protein B0H13DRAFT_1869573 [Mycena leptocephala]